MEPQQEKVSIVMCTYNGARYIREQLDSIVNQTYPIFEMIIQDDGSTDETCTIINEYINRFSYIHLEQNAKQLGVDENFFTALAKATGDYIAIADQDDIWLPNKIELQVAALDAHPDALICGHDALFFYDNKIPHSPYPLIKSKDAISLEKCILHGSYLGHTMLLRKTLLDLFFCTFSIDDRRQLERYMYYDFILYAIAASLSSPYYIAQYLALHRRLIDSETYIAKHNYKGLWNSAKNFCIGFRNYTNPIISAQIQSHFKMEEEFLQRLESLTKRDFTNMIIICKKLAQHKWLNLSLLSSLMKISSIYGKGVKKYLLAFIQPIMVYYSLPAKIRKLSL